MMHLLLYSLIFSMNIIFTQINHPLAMGLLLLCQTTLMCLLTGTLTQTFWFSYILFLIFMGGLLVLFIYVTSLASNEMFKMSMKMIFIFFLTITILMMIFLLNDQTMFYVFSTNSDMISNKTFSSENILLMIKLYNYPNFLTTLLLMNYLFMTLIAIVKITKLFYGPLRLMN